MQRGLVIAAMVKLNGKDGSWLVPSQSCEKVYTVDPVGQTCTCPDHQEWHHKCKHIFAVEITIKREISDDGQTITETKSITFTEERKYSQNWEAYNEAQRTEKARFQVLLHELCKGVQEPAEKPGKRGPKPHTFADSIFAMTFKIYCGFSTRRSSTDFAEAHDKGFTSRLIPGMKVCQFHENPALTPILSSLIVQSSLPLRAVESQFAIDSSGFSGCRFDRWVIEKHGTKVQKSEHTWVKAHIAIGTKTQVICAATVLEKNSADCPQFAGLAKTTAQGFAIGEMSADKAYLSGANVDTIFGLGGVPFIAPKTNTTGGIGGLFEKMFHFFSYRRDEFMQHYHRRSNIESAFGALKRKFGDGVRSKTDTAMKNEVLSKILAYNLCVLLMEQETLGIVPEFWKDGATVKDAAPPVLIEAGRL
jgi:transposase